MTTTSPAPRIEPGTTTEWRQLGRWLWAGRREGRPVGTIEQGRRFVLTVAAGETRRAYRSFAAAAAAADLPAPMPAAPAPRSSLLTSAVAATLVLGGGFAMGAGALAVLAAA